jgi:transposase-like protein
VLEEEVTAFIGAQPYERTQQRRDQRPEHYTRDLEPSTGQIEDLPVPRTRGAYRTHLFERYQRRRDELDSAMGEMFVQGVRTRKVGQVIETLTGSPPRATTLSRVFHTLEAEYEQGKTRRVEERDASAFAEGTYFTVIYNDEGCKMPIWAVVGISESAERQVLAFHGARENEQAWKDLFDDLKARGVKAID